MLYRYLNSKKGFTMMEILIVVIIMGILVAVAVPVFGAGLKKQKQNECSNQRIIISTAVKQAMYGMIDNGKKQDKITFTYSEPGKTGEVCPNKNEYPGDEEDNTSDDDFVGKPCFKLTNGEDCFTLYEVRGGYRSGGETSDYKKGCEEENAYLKKKKYLDNKTPFYVFLDNQEVPVCPFADDKNSQGYYYYVLEDGSVLCSCPECNEAD